MTLPVNIVKRILYLDLSFFISSIKPIKAASPIVIIKIKITLKKKGNSIIAIIEATNNPMTILNPPDSAISGRAFLWIS